jgi:hypothetical protein
MGKSARRQETLHHDFVFASDGDLNKQIAEFAAEHQAQHGDRLAMDSRTGLGAGRVRITFRLVPPKSGKGRR